MLWLGLRGVGSTTLRSPGRLAVSEYTTALHLDHDPQKGYRYVLDLGSTAGGLGSVRINDAEAKGFDTSKPVIDVTEDLRASDNSVTIRVSSSLNNRLWPGATTTGCPTSS